MSLLALAGGSFIFIGVIIVLLFVVIFSYYTYRGSTINPHPSDGREGSPGAEAPSDPAGRARVPEDPKNPGNEGSIPTHGTR